jgi:transcriptional regulator with XRE-family HTH domain
MGFEDDFNRLFEALDIPQAELAARLGVSPEYVSKVLNGRAGNYELKTMAKWARAVGGIVQVRVIKEHGEAVRIVDYETARTIDAKADT